MASIRVHGDIYAQLVERATAERRSVASLASVLLREGLSERGQPAREMQTLAREALGEEHGPSASVPRDLPRSESPRNVTALVKDCKNSDYHWKLQPGETCRWCGGTP